MSRLSASFGWPDPREGPKTTNKYEASSNPLLRGYSLAMLTTIVKSSSWIQSVLWKMNKFEQLKAIPKLTEYEPRYDPTVIRPIKSDAKPCDVSDLSEIAGRKESHAYYTVGDYAAAYRTGRFSPTTVVRSLLLLIQDKSQKNNRFAVAYLQVQQQLVLKAAEASTERWKQGKPLSPLDGVPVAVKDEADLAGYSRCLGSPVDMKNPLDTTAWCVQKWEDAGAIIIGKTNMHEIGMDTNGNNPWYGTPLMPHNESYYPGGSSSGSAVTVAQGICPIALGTDAGGSIRVPSSFCGVYGLKTSQSRVSSRPTHDLVNSVSVYGPIASDLDSLEIAYRIMAQPDPENHRSRSFPNPLSAKTEITTSNSKIIGICKDWIARADPIVLELFNTAVQYYCEVLGYTTVDINIPYLPEGQKSHALTVLSEARSSLSTTQFNKLSYPNQLLLSIASSNATAQDLLAAQRMRNMTMQHLHGCWKIKHSSDVTNGYGVSDGNQSLRTMEYVYLANWTGCPAISRPMGYAEGNIPVGLMAMGPWGSEDLLIMWAREGEELLDGGYIRRPTEPGHWVDVLR